MNFALVKSFIHGTNPSGPKENLLQYVVHIQMVGDCLSYHYERRNHSYTVILTGEMCVVELYQNCSRSLSSVTLAYFMLLTC